jgi:hypothetical protein
MNFFEAATLYMFKAPGSWLVPDKQKSTQTFNGRAMILKTTEGKRLALIFETKKGYVIDLAKKIHNIPADKPAVRPVLGRDAKGRFVKSSL